MALKFKEGINVCGIRPELLLGLTVCSGVYDRFGLSCTITSVVDGKHSTASLHYGGQAADLRIWGVGDAEVLAREIREDLGNSPDYDVVVEKDHIHFEYQPKRR